MIYKYSFILVGVLADQVSLRSPDYTNLFLRAASGNAICKKSANCFPEGLQGIYGIRPSSAKISE